MRRWLPILAVIAGLGSLISCKRTPVVQSKPVMETPKPSALASKASEPETVATEAASEADQTDPFTRYLTVRLLH